MEDYVKSLLEANIVTKEEARRVLLQAADEGTDEISSGDNRSSGAMGGVKVDRTASSKAEPIVGGGGGNADGSYSF
jgi:hypothetical protein